MCRAVKLMTALTLDYLYFSYVCTLASMWQSVKGRFISVIGANISCACAKSPEGLSPSAHLADGCMDLILVKHTSRFQYLKHMLRITSKADQVSSNHCFIRARSLRKESGVLFRSAIFATLDTRRELGPVSRKACLRSWTRLNFAGKPAVKTEMTSVVSHFFSLLKWRIGRWKL